jgi:atypical dual specificity phosphatase
LTTEAIGTTVWRVMMHSFYWLIEGVLAGCGRPGQRHRPPDGASSPPDPLATDLGWLKTRGIGALLILTEEPLRAGVLDRYDLATVHVPIPDLHAPTLGELEQALTFIDWQRAAGRAVAVHCLMGQGRTGTILGAYLIRGGLSAEAALQEVRAACPGAVGSAAQEAFLREYATSRAWLV